MVAISIRLLTEAASEVVKAEAGLTAGNRFSLFDSTYILGEEDYYVTQLVIRVTRTICK